MKIYSLISVLIQIYMLIKQQLLRPLTKKQSIKKLLFRLKIFRQLLKISHSLDQCIKSKMSKLFKPMRHFLLNSGLWSWLPDNDKICIKLNYSRNTAIGETTVVFSTTCKIKKDLQWIYLLSGTSCCLKVFLIAFNTKLDCILQYCTHQEYDDFCHRR